MSHNNRSNSTSAASHNAAAVAASSAQDGNQGGMFSPQHLPQHSMQQHAMLFGASASNQDDDSTDGGLDEDNPNKKPRIPWDRNPRTDRNQLKYALLSCVNEHQFHVKGKLMENFKVVSSLLSSGPNSPFLKFRGVEPSGAQRKFNSVLRNVAKTFRFNETGDISLDESNLEPQPFEQLALQMLRDIIEKEKQRKTHRRQSKSSSDPNMSFEEDPLQSFDDVGVTMLKKRKSDVVDLKNVIRKAASAQSGVEIHGSLLSNTPGKGAKIHRLDVNRHERVVEELKRFRTPILTVGDLLRVADISPTGISAFVNSTGVKLEKPVNRALKLYEEFASSADYSVQMKALCGFSLGDALELENFLKPFYSDYVQLV